MSGVGGRRVDDLLRAISRRRLRVALMAVIMRPPRSGAGSKRAIVGRSRPGAVLLAGDAEDWSADLRLMAEGPLCCSPHAEEGRALAPARIGRRQPYR